MSDEFKTIEQIPEGAIKIGMGALSWNANERRSDRYGSVSLFDVPGPDGRVLPLAKDVAGKGILFAHVTATCKSWHIGDLFRGIFPSQPDVGDLIVLGDPGDLFFEMRNDIRSVGIRPIVDRDSDWLNPHALYRLHDQTVELYFLPE